VVLRIRGDKMKVIIHGGAKEVGRQCIEVVTKQGRFLLDGGVKLGEEAEYPEEIKNIRNIDAAFLTHAHLDHCGAWPYLQSKGLRCPIYMTSTTRSIAKILIRDFYKVESLHHIPAYKKENIFKAFDLFKTIHYSQSLEIKDAYFKFFDAGHIPGSAFILVESNGKRIIYTGDIRLSTSRLMEGADLGIRDVDALIMETTYGNREHPDRKKTELEFLAKIKETLRRGGKVFIPAFSVGRSQEILLLLHSQKWNVPIYLDGMGKDITDLIIEHEAAKDSETLKRVKNKTIFVNGRSDRERAMKRQGIFVASAGMMTGGSIIEYLKEGHQDKRNSILLTGYVAEGTNGRLLLDTGTIFIDGRKTKVKAEYQQYNFSAHAGLSELKELVKKINPQKLILIHGELESLEKFAESERKNGKEVFIPEMGSEINI